jgi:hypothetical protein
MKSSVVDNGDVWYIDCLICGGMHFHHKIVIYQTFDEYYTPIYMFDCVAEDDNKEGGKINYRCGTV